MNKTIKSTIRMFKVAVRNFLLLRKAPKRASRKEYWSFVLISIPLLFSANLVSLILFRSLVLGLIFESIFYIILFHLSIRRCHDVGIISAPAYLSFLGTLLGVFITGDFQTDHVQQTAEFIDNIRQLTIVFGIVNIALFIITLLPGTPGKNRFGDKPTE